ncbi:MAG: hypothetical protein A3F72_14135 [Bacteroidetes bacterium RIFCSPLOWO2_12_FULL_35_15]|nr:MAG: hypothetical protein A3F72_14135 [Bacteroidetes bacterium RIFCSPLOWO2_12_FULL_35_15]
MKINKPIILHVPAKLVQELDKYLLSNPPEFKYDLSYIYYTIHYMMGQRIKNKSRNETGSEVFLPLNSNTLRSIIGINTGNYIKILLDGEFIKSDNKYIVGEKCLGYTINPDFLQGVDTVEINAETKLFSKIIKHQRLKKAHNNRLDPFLKLMWEEFMNIEIDYQNAEKWVLNQPDEEKRTSYMMSLSQLEDKRFRYFKRNKTNNRLDTNITNLKGDLRQFIIGDYVSIDLRNSQPFLLSILLGTIINKDSKQQGSLCCNLHILNLLKTFGSRRIRGVINIHQNDKKAYLVNLNDFASSVTLGNLYEDFVERYSNGLTRKDVKDIMFKVMFSKNESKKNKNFIPFEKEKKIFAKVYPYVYNSIKMLKSKDNVLLPVFLQKLESYIFIDCIAKDLVNAGIIPLTIHDSVIIKAEQKEKALEIIKRTFSELFDVIPTFEVKPLKQK